MRELRQYWDKRALPYTEGRPRQRACRLAWAETAKASDSKTQRREGETREKLGTRARARAPGGPLELAQTNERRRLGDEADG